MKKPNVKLAIPIWARQIEVERRDDYLMVTGRGHMHIPYDVKLLATDEMAKVDMLQRFRWYGLERAERSGRGGDAGVYQFASADSDEKLIDFVSRFGPVWGVVRAKDYENDGFSTLTVAQDMEVLRDERRRFASITKLLQQLNRNGRVNRDVVMEQLLEIPWLAPYGQILNGGFQYGGPTDQKAATRYWANHALCMELNYYRPKLVPFQGDVYEMPEMSDEGIRNEIYWQLRLDYLAQRAIGTCLNCGGHFPVYKRGSRACGESCRRALRNRKYWRKNKRTVNRNRRTKLEEGE